MKERKEKGIGGERGFLRDGKGGAILSRFADSRGRETRRPRGGHCGKVKACNHHALERKNGRVEKSAASGGASTRGRLTVAEIAIAYGGILEKGV